MSYFMTHSVADIGENIIVIDPYGDYTASAGNTSPTNIENNIVLEKCFPFFKYIIIYIRCIN